MDGDCLTQIELSSCEQYRYRLWQIWQPDTDTVAFIGLNPSAADANDKNPTFQRCLNYAKRWGFGGLYLVNLFAYRAATPHLLKQAHAPIGPQNDATLDKISQHTQLQVAAWGNDGAFLERSVAVRQILPNLHALKINQSGEPAHPLYLRADLEPFPFLN